MKKMLAICLVLVLALAGIGVGYAMWSETLYIEGTVTTGNVDVEWSQGTPWDTETKDVSEAVCSISADGSTLTITVTNAYPCIDYYIPVDIHSLGSVPVHLANVTLDSDLPGDVDQDGLVSVVELLDVCVCGSPSCTIGPFETPLDLSSTQLHQGDAVYGIIHIHLTNDVTNAVQTFTITGSIMAHQYNETP